MRGCRQASESIKLGIVLAVAGGFMDAYSYICRGQVFANAQTGNMLLLGINIAERNWKNACYYLCPVLAFTLGIMLADFIRMRAKDGTWFHWRQIAIFFEALVLAGVCFIPQRMNLLANSLISLGCGIQVESFRKIYGNAIATTMCIGNLRSATQHFCDFIGKKKKESIKKCLLYLGIIFAFIVGAIIGNIAIEKFHEMALLMCSLFLLIGFLMMFTKNE
ncbi:MAG: DUF1275 domain-containing protein [Lachnospiraceae bacterium]|nr:DUF1275 domain-containing protein [Lachnospiraceae bacterium]